MSMIKENFDIDSFRYFETSKGSKYIINKKNQLTRWKSYHHNTSGEDMGLHSWSDFGIFVDPIYYDAVTSFEQLSTNKGYKVGLSKDAEGKMFYMIFDGGDWRPAKWSDAFPTYVAQNPELKNKVLSWRYTKEPTIGYHVIDFSFKSRNSTQISSFHPGNTVSRIEDSVPEEEKGLFVKKEKLQENIQRIKQIIGVICEENLPPTPKELIRTLPEDLKKLLFKQWGAKQNPEWHPEGNSLKHIIVVIKRAYHHYPDDPNMIMAALFHDLGKMDTYGVNPKTGQPTAYGHEDKSTDYIEQFKDWILSFDGTDIDEIKYLVKNHMKVKPKTWDSMRDTKKDPIKSHPAFDKLMGFTDKLDGGGIDIEKRLNESIKKIKKLINNINESTYNIQSVLKIGSSGSEVEVLQDILGIHKDGKFGPQTEKCVKDFQSSEPNVIDGDGIVGELTLKKLKDLEDGTIKWKTPPYCKNKSYSSDNEDIVVTPKDDNVSGEKNSVTSDVVIFMAGLESMKNKETQSNILDTSLGRGKKRIITHSYKDLSGLKNSIKKNPNAPVILFSKACESSSIVANLINDKTKLFIVEPYAKNGNSSVVGAVKSGVPASNVIFGNSTSRGLGVVKGATKNTIGDHFDALKFVARFIK